MDIITDAINAISNIECGWTNCWAFQDQKEKLFTVKKEALLKSYAFKMRGYDIIDIYKQLDKFDDCIKAQTLTLTQEEDEKLLLAVKYYADNNIPIIKTKFTDNLNELYTITPEEKIKSAWRYKYDVYSDLMNFYLGYAEEINLFETFLKFMDFTEYLIQKYPTENNHYNHCNHAIYYLKFLIKKKEFDKAKHIVNNYTFIPRGKTETTAFEKILLKLKETPLIK